jgi:hypothetical protein
MELRGQGPPLHLKLYGEDAAPCCPVLASTHLLFQL